MSYLVERIEYERCGSGERKPYSRYRIVKRTGVYSAGGFKEVEPPKVLEDNLLLAEAKERVKFWRDGGPASSGPSYPYIWQNIGK